MAAIDCRLDVARRGRTAVHLVSAGDVRRSRAHRQRSITGDLVAIAGACVVGECHCGRSNRFVQGEGDAGVGDVARGIGVGDQHGVAAVGCWSRVARRRRAAVHLVGTGDIGCGRADGERSVIGDLVAAAGTGVVGERYRRRSNGRV